MFLLHMYATFSELLLNLGKMHPIGEIINIREDLLTFSYITVLRKVFKIDFCSDENPALFFTGSSFPFSPLNLF